MPKSGKEIQKSVRMTPELWAAAQRVAPLTGRSAGALMCYALELYIMRNYPKAMEKGAKLTLSLVEAPVEKRRLAGIARAESLTPARRSEIARTAAEARWHRRDIQ